MNIFFTAVVVVQILSALVIIGLVLLQHGKGADMGAAFGSGASGSLFGATGSSNFLSKSTGVAAALFFASTLGLGFLGGKHPVSGGVFDSVPATSAPAATVPVSAASSAASIPATVTPGTVVNTGAIPPKANASTDASAPVVPVASAAASAPVASVPAASAASNAVQSNQIPK
jgi:preprotein translocase subunit SecG